MEQNKVLPEDKTIIQKTLKNGFTYILKENKSPKNKIEFRLAAKTGSINEQDDEQGLAHFLEHMIFKGTTKYPKNQIIDKLQKLGVVFGRELNAYTSFDKTVYFLPIPKNEVDFGLDILREWSSEVTIEESEFEKERPVILEEVRQGQGAEERMRKIWLKKLLKGSKYAQRFPIGLKEIIKSTSRDKIYNFYKNFYSPENLVLVAVGDFKKEDLEKKIIEKFSSLKKTSTEDTKIPLFEVKQEEVQSCVSLDNEAQYSLTRFIFKKKQTYIHTLEDYTQFVLCDLTARLLSERLAEKTEEKNSPLLYGAASWQRLISGLEAFIIAAIAINDKEKQSIELLSKEIKIMRKFGFSQNELDRVKLIFSKNIEDKFLEKDKTNSDLIADEYLNNFLDQDSIIGIEEEKSFYQDALSLIDIKTINNFIKQLLNENNLLISFSGQTELKIQENDILEVFNSSQAGDTSAYNEQNLSKELCPVPQNIGEITERIYVEKLNTHIITLNNGVKVVIKPTKYKDNEIIFYAERKGGRSNLNSEYDLPSSILGKISKESGLSDFSKTELQKKLAGKKVSLALQTGNYFDAVKGKASKDDIKTLFELIYLQFTCSDLKPDAFEKIIEQEKSNLKTYFNEPENILKEKIIEVMTQKHERNEQICSEEELNNLSLEDVKNVFKRNFSKANEFVFFFVGSINEKEIEDLSKKYLANLPSDTKSLSTFNDMMIRPPKGYLREIIYAGEEDKCVVHLFLTQNFKYSKQNALCMLLFGDALQISLTEKLRNELSGIYSHFVELAPRRLPYQRAMLHINFTCSEDNYQNFISLTNDIIKDFSQNGLPQDLAEKVIKAEKKSLSEKQERNSYWSSKLQDAFFFDEKIETIAENEKLIDTITKSDIDNAIKIFSTPDSLVEIIMLPKNSKKN